MKTRLRASFGSLSHSDLWSLVSTTVTLGVAIPVHIGVRLDPDPGRRSLRRSEPEFD